MTMTHEKEWVATEANTGLGGRFLPWDTYLSKQLRALVTAEEEEAWTQPILFPGLPLEWISVTSDTALAFQDIEVVEILRGARISLPAGQRYIVFLPSMTRAEYLGGDLFDVADVTSHTGTNIGSFGAYTPDASNLLFVWQGANIQLGSSKTVLWEQQEAREALIRREMQNIFSAGASELFQDGEESEFSTRLLALISGEGVRVISVLQGLILNERTSAKVASEALRWLAEVENAASYNARRELLEKCLNAKSSKIRDGALIGLASLNDRRSVVALREAINVEHISLLRGCMSRVMRQLESDGR